MEDAKLNNVPFIGEFITGKYEKTGERILSADGKKLDPKISQEQMQLALQIQKEQAVEGKSPFILNVLADNAEKISVVGKAYQKNEVWEWKKEFLPFQASKRAEAAKDDMQNLDQLDPKSLQTQSWMFNARKDEPSVATSAIEVANVANLTVRLTKEAVNVGKEVSYSVKQGVADASRLVQALTSQDEGKLLGKKPEDLLRNVRKAFNESAESVGKGQQVKGFNDAYFANISAGLKIEQQQQKSRIERPDLTDAEKETRGKVLKIAEKALNEGKLTPDSYTKLKDGLKNSENVKQLHKGYAKKEAELRDQKAHKPKSR